MAQRRPRVIQQHVRTGPAHHPAYGLAPVTGIAVHRTALARLLVLAEAAVVKSQPRILTQAHILLRHLPEMQTVAAVQVDHLADDGLLTDYFSFLPVHLLIQKTHHRNKYCATSASFSPENKYLCRMRHHFRHILLAALALLVTPRLQAQSADERISTLIARSDYTALAEALDTTPRDSLDPMLRDMANALTCHYLNRCDDAVRLLRRLITRHQKELSADNSVNLAMLIPFDLARLGRYSEAWHTAENLAQQFETIDGMKAQCERMRSMAEYYRLLSDVGDICRPLHDTGDDQRVSFFIDRRIHGTDKGGFLTVNGHIGSTPTLITVDTGAGVNVISREDASRMGLLMLDYHVRMSGTGISEGQLAIADTLRLGRGMTWRNVPFFVVDMHTGHAEADRRIDRGLAPIIGVEMLRQMSEMRLDFDRSEMTVPAHPTRRPSRYPNLLLEDAGQLTVALKDSTYGPLRMSLDTGSYDTMLFSDWYKSHRTEVERTGRADSLRTAGVGGVVMQHAYRLGGLRLQVGDTAVTTDSITVATGQDLHTGQPIAPSTYFDNAHDGLLGLSFLQRCRQVIINVRDMFLAVRKE